MIVLKGGQARDRTRDVDHIMVCLLVVLQGLEEQAVERDHLVGIRIRSASVNKQRAVPQDKKATKEAPCLLTDLEELA